jgi:hypothetical protein
MHAAVLRMHTPDDRLALVVELVVPEHLLAQLVDLLLQFLA